MIVERTWLITGVPRSGSSLCCRLAGELPDAVALSEPLTRTEFQNVDSQEEACSRIADFALRTRVLIASERRASSVQISGRLDDNMVATDMDIGGVRRRQATHGVIRIDKPLSRHFTLVIKHNALFAALLPRLTVLFPCLALVRNPVAVLASWMSVDLPVQRGYVPAAEQYDARLREKLSREPRVIERQVIVLNWFFERYASSLPRERIVRYEDVIESGGLVLYEALGHSHTQPATLASRNANPLYRRGATEIPLATLLNGEGAWRRFYSDEDCRQAANALRQTAVPRGDDLL